MSSETFTAGQTVKYRCVCRGGYGFVRFVSAKFLRFTGSGTKQRATIEVTIPTSGRKKRISVKPQNIAGNVVEASA